MYSRKDAKKKPELFDRIAPIYNLFYGYQKRRFNSVLDIVYQRLDFSPYKDIIDIGCGTGALCSVLNQKGFKVTGVDQSEKMISRAIARRENGSIEFIRANILERLPFEDKAFDVSIASYVAHGLTADKRRIMYLEMGRITKHLVIIFDYNQRRGLLTDIVEGLEGGDYFNFISRAEDEMKECFSEVRSIEVGPGATWYVCKVREN